MSQALAAEAAERRGTFTTLCADDRAFSAWYESALPRVYGFVYARSGDMALAEDITAQAFLEAIRARGSFDGRSDPVTWICAIARNRLSDHYRSVARDLSAARQVSTPSFTVATARTMRATGCRSRGSHP